MTRASGRPVSKVPAVTRWATKSKTSDQEAGPLGGGAERATSTLSQFRAVKRRFGEHLLHAQDTAVGGAQLAFTCTKFGLERGLKPGLGERVHGQDSGLHEVARVHGVRVGRKLAVGIAHGATKARLVEVRISAIVNT